MVTNREPISKGLLERHGFNTSNTHSLTCPAFRFEPTLVENNKVFTLTKNL